MMRVLRFLKVLISTSLAEHLQSFFYTLHCLSGASPPSAQWWGQTPTGNSVPHDLVTKLEFILDQHIVT